MWIHNSRVIQPYTHLFFVLLLLSFRVFVFKTKRRRCLFPFQSSHDVFIRVVLLLRCEQKQRDVIFSLLFFWSLIVTVLVFAFSPSAQYCERGKSRSDYYYFEAVFLPGLSSDLTQKHIHLEFRRADETSVEHHSDFLIQTHFAFLYFAFNQKKEKLIRLSGSSYFSCTWAFWLFSSEIPFPCPPIRHQSAVVSLNFWVIFFFILSNLAKDSFRLQCLSNRKIRLKT